MKFGCKIWNYCGAKRTISQKCGGTEGVLKNLNVEPQHAKQKLRPWTSQQIQRVCWSVSCPNALQLVFCGTITTRDWTEVRPAAPGQNASFVRSHHPRDAARCSPDRTSKRDCSGTSAKRGCMGGAWTTRYITYTCANPILGPLRFHQVLKLVIPTEIQPLNSPQQGF